jgi:polysaccharide export outer membrane protein
MKCRAGNRIESVLVLMVLCGSTLGSARAAVQTNGGATTAPAANAQMSNEVTTGKAHDDAFIIGNEDMLAISVWKEPELSKSVPVRSDGRISLPLVGEIQAAGKTPLQLETDIAGKLTNFITAPEVTVIVEKVNSKKFNIVGEVSRPGSYAIATATTIMDAIAAAGGFRDFAKKTGVYILRKSPDGREARINFNYKEFIKGKNPDQNVKLQADDTIIVP